MPILSKKILIIDDEPDVGNVLKHYLSARRFDVFISNSGEAGLKILEKEKVDLVLLDLVMHGMSGRVVAKIIKEKYPNTKIILVTAYPDEADLTSLNVPIDGCFIKPAGLEDLYNKLLAM